MSHTFEDIRQCAPLPLLNTNLFESVHSPFKQLRIAKRTSVNVLYTLISHHEKLRVYYATGELNPTDIEKSVEKASEDELVQEYLNTH